MMTMTIDRGKFVFLLVSLAFFSTGNLFGQQKDFQSWYELQLNYGLKSGIDLSLEAEQRFENNSLQYDRSLITLTADYDLTDYLNAELGVRGLLRMDRERRLQPRYRVHADLALERTIAVVDFSFRSRIQYGFDEMDVLDDAGYNKLSSRNRIMADYHIFGTRIELSASVESWHQLGGQAPRAFNKIRYSAGIQYMLNFRSDISLRYMLEDEFNVTNPLQAHIIRAGFSYDL